MSPRPRTCLVAVALLLVPLAACNRSATTTAPTGGGAGARGGGGETSPAKEGWQEFQIPGVGASVLLPGSPIKNEYPSEKDGVAYVAFGGEPSIEVNVLVFTPPAPAGQAVEQALDEYVKRQENTVPVAGVHMAGLPARGYVVRDGADKPVWEDRLVAVGEKWVILRSNDPTSNPEANKKFFESFKRPAGR